MQTSVFDLETSVTGQAGASRAKYVQHPTLRDVTGTFSGAPITFQWTNSRSTYIVPSRSYIRMRCYFELQKNGDADKLTHTKLFPRYAPSINLGHSFWQSCQWKIGNRTVSRIQDYVTQIGALDCRLHDSQDWINTVGRATNFAQESFSSRMTGVNAQSVKNRTLNCSSTALGVGTIVDSGAAAAVRFLYTQGDGKLEILLAGGAAPTLPFVGAFANLNVGDYVIVSDDYPPQQVLDINLTTGIIKLEIHQLCEDLGPLNLDDIKVLNAPYDVPSERGAGEFEICFQLPLSIWKHSSGIPACNHQLELMPKTEADLVKSVVETWGIHVATSDIKFKVQEMYFHAYEVDGAAVYNTSFVLDLEQTMCQTQQLTTNGWSQRTVDVSPSTFGLTLAYQDNRVNNDTRCSAARFTVLKTASNGETLNQPVSGTDVSKEISRFYVQYAGQNHPSPDADPEYKETTDGGITFDGGRRDWRTERYVQTMLNSGGYFKDSPESLEEFYARGPYYYFAVPRDASDRSTRVTIAQDFNNTVTSSDTDNTFLMLFDHSRQVCKITIDNGMVADVQIQDD